MIEGRTSLGSGWEPRRCRARPGAANCSPSRGRFHRRAVLREGVGARHRGVSTKRTSHHKTRLGASRGAEVRACSKGSGTRTREFAPIGLMAAEPPGRRAEIITLSCPRAARKLHFRSRQSAGRVIHVPSRFTSLFLTNVPVLITIALIRSGKRGPQSQQSIPIGFQPCTALDPDRWRGRPHRLGRF